ncbi:MAG: helix-turn-helix domain-containing protein [Coriobacteriales bacterium]|jgi:transcriptional regulator with XRE-family HTH domain|nr:helix-turn-helix domain-containing protein [Coriobacteriales bacterium]
MMKTAASIVTEIRKARVLSMNALAVLAGIPASTISRIESGKIEPTYSLLQRIVTAAGFSFDSQVQEGGSDQPIATYLARLKENDRAINSVAAKELLAVASLASVAKRQGARCFERDKNLKETVSDLERQDQKPIVSALEAYFGSVDAIQSFIPIVYTDAPEAIKGLKSANAHSAQVIFVLSTTSNVRDNSRNRNGIAMVSEEWGLLDALASPGRQPDATLEILVGTHEVTA